jgi:geranylgeranyl reductase family protein
MSDDRDYDVIVVGAGPAGVSTALVAARAGLRVLLLDRRRFPRPKVCGDAITPLGLKMLGELGLLETVRRVADEELPRIQLGFGERGGTSTLDTPVLVVRRYILDATLVDFVRPIVDVREGSAVTTLRWRDGAVCGVTGETDRGTAFTVSANVVVGADGASSIIARLTGCRESKADRMNVAIRAYYRDVVMTSRAPEFHFLPELGGGYLWIFPAGGNRFNVGIGATDDTLHALGTPLRELLARALASPAFAERFANASTLDRFEGGQIPCNGLTQQLSGAGFMLVGDAAGVADPFWGDGIDTALMSGSLAAGHIVAAHRARDFGGPQLASYARGVIRVLGPKLARGIERQQAAAL